MNRRVLLIICLFLFSISCITGYLSGFGLESLVKTANIMIKPGIGSIVYVHSELAEVQNGSMAFLGKRLYEPWEPVVIIESGEDHILVRFCSDGYESTYSRSWFATYRLTTEPASFAHCDK